MLCAGGALWITWLLRRGRADRILAPYLLVNAAAALAWAWIAGLDEDEAELLHTTWMVAHGATPYVDFWQHHLPMAWIALAPLVRALEPSPSICP